MELKQLIEEYSNDGQRRRQAIFASLFLIQNRLQTACDKLDEEITMKQWLLLAMAGTSKEPMSLTDLGKLMGCSRQNVKKIGDSLELKGFLHYERRDSDSRALCIVLNDRVQEYTERVGVMQQKVLELLFQGFTEEETCSLYDGIMKLQTNMESIEKYVEEPNER